MDQLSERWAREAERLHQRYLIEVVEAYGLCPWAERARRGGRTRVQVVLGVHEPPVAGAIAALNGWGDDDQAEIGFIVFPRLVIERHDFDRLVAHLRDLDAAGHVTGRAPFTLAAFHPDALPDLEDADRLVPFLRRTPDPCVQAVRMSCLERVRGNAPHGTQFVDVAQLDGPPCATPAPPLRERIARANLETVARIGVDELSARIDAIHEDRARTYAALEATLALRA